MAEIIKTWPAATAPRVAAEIFSADEPPFGHYFFSLGRGRPQRELSRVWFTYRGRILGSFAVAKLVRNDGSLPKLCKLDGDHIESDWQIKPDAWVAICTPGCRRIRERVYMSGFRGWRYFDFDSYKSTMEAKVRL